MNKKKLEDEIQMLTGFSRLLSDYVLLSIEMVCLSGEHPCPSPTASGFYWPSILLLTYSYTAHKRVTYEVMEKDKWCLVDWVQNYKGGLIVTKKHANDS